MQRFNLSKKLFDFEGQSSEESADSVIYISSDSEDEVSKDWDSDWSTDTEALINRIEREVKSSPILIAGRVMTTEGLDEEMEAAGPSNAQMVPPSTPKLGFKYFDKEKCLAPSKKQKTRIELCSTVLPVLESPMPPTQNMKRDHYWTLQYRKQ